MGKLILCNGTYGKKPYYMIIGNVNLYSIEELAYYIVTNLEFFIELELEKDLIVWIRKELAMDNLADKLQQLYDEKGDNKRIIETILNSCNYYTPYEQKKIISSIEELECLPLVKRKIKKANYLLIGKRFKEAEIIYEKILKSTNLHELSQEEYAQVLHNLGIAKIHTVGIKESSQYFKEAYVRSHNEESLKEYLIGLKLSGQEEVMIKEIDKYQLDKKWMDEFYSKYNQYREGFLTSIQYTHMQKLNERRKENTKDFIKMTNNIIRELESQYRRCTNENN